MQKRSVPFRASAWAAAIRTIREQRERHDQPLAKAAEPEELRPAIEQSGDRDRKRPRPLGGLG